MYNCYAAAGYYGYLAPLLRSGKFNAVDDVALADVILFAGGSDISPHLYGQKPGRYTYTAPKRDQIEVEEYNYAKAAGIPMIGICRGMQLLTALEGGSLYQHVDNHAGARHKMLTEDGQELMVNSLHHQMCNPWDGVEDFKLIGWTPEPIAGTIIGADDHFAAPPPYEPEAIYYPKSNAFAVQWHPEMMHQSEQAVQWYLAQVDKLLVGGFEHESR